MIWLLFALICFALLTLLAILTGELPWLIGPAELVGGMAEVGWVPAAILFFVFYGPLLVGVYALWRALCEWLETRRNLNR